jgi:hypothetical protein
MVENSFEQNESDEITYEETIVETFEEASNRVIEEDMISGEGIHNFLIVDVDGVLIDNNFIEQLPFVSHLFTPSVKDSTKDSFKRISTIFKDCMAIATNRDRSVRIFWNSDKVMSKSDELVSYVEENIPVFEKMQKQTPSLARDRAVKLVEYIATSLTQSEGFKSKEKIVINCIEDVSIVSPNRKSFLMYLARMLKGELEIEVAIQNYVIK